MNIDKIKNYNQKVLAILGTLLIAIARVSLLILLIFGIIELWPESNPTKNELLSKKEVEELKKDSLRKQIISYDDPSLIDTSNLIYLIPVHVLTLDKPEEVSNEVLGLQMYMGMT